jgi:opacity protein-like surface antigen
MRTSLLAGVAAVALMPMAALAADMPLKAPLMAPVGFDWNGFYVGAHIGWAWSSHSTDSFNGSLAFLDTTSFNSNGFFGGGQGGYNWVFMPNWLLGLEIDGSPTAISTDTSGCSSTGCATSNVKTDYFTTVRGRLGYTMNNVLFYGTGGWAAFSGTTTRTVTCVVAGGGTCPGGPSPSALTGRSATSSGFSTGWAAGGGIEWGFAPRWTAKVEYLHLQFDEVRRDYVYAGFPTAERHNVTKVGDDTVRLGINYMFTPGR